MNWAMPWAPTRDTAAGSNPDSASSWAASSGADAVAQYRPASATSAPYAAGTAPGRRASRLPSPDPEAPGANAAAATARPRAVTPKAAAAVTVTADPTFMPYCWHASFPLRRRHANGLADGTLEFVPLDAAAPGAAEVTRPRAGHESPWATSDTDAPGMEAVADRCGRLKGLAQLDRHRTMWAIFWADEVVVVIEAGVQPDPGHAAGEGNGRSRW